MVQFSAADLRERMAEVIDLAAHRHERVVVTRRGKPVAAVVPIEDLELIEQLEEQQDNRIADQRLQDLAAGKEQLVPWEEVIAKNRL